MQQKQKLTQIFNHANSTIRNMISYLHHFYQQNGINYPIGQFQAVIFRILAPVELLGHPPPKHNDIPDFGYANTHNDDNQHKDQRAMRVNKVPTMGFRNNNGQGFGPGSEDSSRVKGVNGINVPKLRTMDSDLQGKRRGRPRALDDEQQRKIVEMIKQQAAKGQTVKRKTILSSVCAMVGDPRFQGSGWLLGFMKRHPDIRNLICKKQFSTQSDPYNDNQPTHMTYISQFDSNKPNFKRQGSKKPDNFLNRFPQQQSLYNPYTNTNPSSNPIIKLTNPNNYKYTTNDNQYQIKQEFERSQFDDDEGDGQLDVDVVEQISDQASNGEQQPGQQAQPSQQAQLGQSDGWDIKNAILKKQKEIQSNNQFR